MAGRKKTFACGHRGRGQYCHRCAQEQEVVARKTAWKMRFDEDAIDLHHLPNRPLIDKARSILAHIQAGKPYTDFRGKRLNHDRTIISVPLGRDYRLLFRDEGGALRPLQCLSHEAYNTKKPGA